MVINMEVFGLNVLPTGAQESEISHLFLHKPSVNIHVLNSSPTPRVNTFTRLIRQMLYKVHIQYFILYIFIFDSVCIY